MSTQSMPSILDREIQTHAEDAFGHRHYAKALRSLAEGDEHVPPYTIGLLGPWGQGKSTTKELYLNDLKRDVSKGEDGTERRKSVRTIFFNAWPHGGENIKRALLRTIYLALGGSDDDLHREFYCQIEKITPERKPIADFMIEVFDKWVIPIVALIVVFAGVGGLAWWLTSYLELTSWWAGLSIPSAIAAAVYLLRDVFNFKLQPLSRYTPVTMIQAPSTTSQQYEALLRGQLEKFKGSKEGKGCKRIVVFVDDLDRLAANEMVAGLDAIRTFIDIPLDHLSDECGIVFVISCDEGRVAEALSRRASQGVDRQLPAAIADLPDARRYLDRIFQFRLEIPLLPRRDMREYGKRLIEGFPAVVESLEKHDTSVTRIIERLIHVGVASPRNALHLANAFLQAWWLAELREGEAPGSDQAGALRPGAVTDHAVSLAGLCVLKVDFPSFYRELQYLPELLPAFIRVVYDGGKIEDEPLAVREALQQFVKSEDGKTVAADRDLRRYIASIRDIQKPRSLRPLLLLSEDKLSRSLGDRAVDVRDSLVSGDADGVLEALGRTEDSKPLGPDNVDLLIGILDDLTADSDERRDLANVAIAELIPRLPQAERRPLVSRLARRLVESRHLRCQLGIERVEHVVDASPENDQRLLVSRLCTDVLLEPSDDWAFATPTGDKPHLDDAVGMAKRVCNLALATRSGPGLQPDAGMALIAWLRHRRVVVDEKTHDCPFADLDNWVEKHEDSLLKELGETYVDQFASELETATETDLDLAACIKRVEKVLVGMIDAGTESGSRGWSLAARLAAVKDGEVPKFVWEFLSKRHDKASNVNVSEVVSGLCKRLEQDMREGEEGDLDWESGAQTLLAITEARAADLAAETVDAIAALVEAWGEDEGTAKYAARGAELVLGTTSKAVDAHVTSWSSALLGDTQIDLVRWLGGGFDSKLSDPQRQAAVGQLDLAVNSDSLTEDQADRFIAFMGALTHEGRTRPAMQKFLKRLFPKISERFNNPNHYLERVFPAVPQLIEDGPNAEGATMLKTLFEQAKAVPGIFGRLHGWMAEYWPEPSDAAPYNPQKLFSDAAEFAQAHSNQPGADGVLKSMASMIDAEIVPAEHEGQLAAAACAAWPHKREAAVQSLLGLHTAPPPTQIAELVQQIDAASDEDYKQLSDVWSHLAALLDNTGAVTVAQHVLSFDQIALPNGKDGALQLWCEVSVEHRNAMLLSLIHSEDLNDSQRHRMWLEIEDRAPDLGPAYLCDIVPPLLVRGDSSNTVAAVIRWADSCDPIFSSLTDQAQFCQALAPAYFDTPSADTRAAIAKWINRWNGLAAIEEEYENRESAEDIADDLKRDFPKLKI